MREVKVDELSKVPQHLDEMHALVSQQEVLAIVEVGLDYTSTCVNKLEQKKQLRNVLVVTRQVGKPVIIHFRDRHGKMSASGDWLAYDLYKQSFRLSLFNAHSLMSYNPNHIF